MLQPDGSLILITLDPYFEIVRLNSDYQKLEQDFTAFRQSSHSKYYKKEIMIDGKGSGNYYYGVLHTLTYLQKIIASNNLSVVKYEELNFIEGGIQKPIYHAYVLRKNGSK